MFFQAQRAVYDQLAVTTTTMMMMSFSTTMLFFATLSVVLLSSALAQTVPTPECFIEVVPDLNGGPTFFQKTCEELQGCAQIGLKLKSKRFCSFSNDPTCSLSVEDTPDLSLLDCIGQVTHIKGHLKIMQGKNKNALLLPNLYDLTGSIHIEVKNISNCQLGDIRIGQPEGGIPLTMKGYIRIDASNGCEIGDVLIPKLSSDTVINGSLFVRAIKDAIIGRVSINRGGDDPGAVTVDGNGVKAVRVTVRTGAKVQRVRIGAVLLYGGVSVKVHEGWFPEGLTIGGESEGSLQVKGDVEVLHTSIMQSVPLTEYHLGLVDLKAFKLCEGTITVQSFQGIFEGFELNVPEGNSTAVVTESLIVNLTSVDGTSDGCPLGWTPIDTQQAKGGDDDRTRVTYENPGVVYGAITVYNGNEANSKCGKLEKCLASQYIPNEFGVCAPVSICGPDEYIVVVETKTSDRVCEFYTTCDPETQYISLLGTQFADRVCANLTNCTEAQWESIPATATSDRECKNFRICQDFEYETVAATTTSNRECELTKICAFATEYESVAPTTTTNRQCEEINDCDYEVQYELSPPTRFKDRVCAPITECLDSEHEVLAPTRSADRECNTTTICITDVEYETVSPSNTSDRKCQTISRCDPGTYISTNYTNTSDRSCEPCVELQSFSTTKNSFDCVDVRSPCVPGTYENVAPTVTSDRICAPCPENLTTVNNTDIIEACEAQVFPTVSENVTIAGTDNSAGSDSLATWAIALIVLLVLCGVMVIIVVAIKIRNPTIYVDPKVSDTNFQMNPAMSAAAKGEHKQFTNNFGGMRAMAAAQNGDDMEAYRDPKTPPRSSVKKSSARPSEQQKNALLKKAVKSHVENPQEMEMYTLASNTAPLPKEEEEQELYLQPVSMKAKPKKKKKKNVPGGDGMAGQTTTTTSTTSSSGGGGQPKKKKKAGAAGGAAKKAAAKKKAEPIYKIPDKSGKAKKNPLFEEEEGFGFPTPGEEVEGYLDVGVEDEPGMYDLSTTIDFKEGDMV